MEFKAVLYIGVMVEAENEAVAEEILRDRIYTIPGYEYQIRLTPVGADAEQGAAIDGEQAAPLNSGS